MIKRERGRPRHPDVLTPAEWSVLDLYRHGLSRRVIARLRGTSEYAVRYHLRNTAAKLGVAALPELRHWPGSPVTSPMRSRTLRAKRFKKMNADLKLDQLAQVSLLCRSAERAEAWYRDVLGLPHLFTFGPLVFLALGETRLYLRQVPENEFRLSSTLYFAVDDINAATARLKERGVRFQGAPHMIYKEDETSTEEWFSFFDDPDGNVLALLARVSPAS